MDFLFFVLGYIGAAEAFINPTPEYVVVDTNNERLIRAYDGSKPDGRIVGWARNLDEAKRLAV